MKMKLKQAVKWLNDQGLPLSYMQVLNDTKEKKPLLNVSRKVTKKGFGPIYVELEELKKYKKTIVKK